MIIATLKYEKVLQVGELTTFEISSLSGEEIDTIEIVVENLADPIDITTDKKLSWQYETEGEKTFVVTITGTDTTKTITKTINVLSEENDFLFSDDNDLISIEDDVLKYCREGKTSFNDKNRLAQSTIVNELAKRRIFKSDNSLYGKSDIANVQCIKDWSKYLALSYIYGGISNVVDDVFSMKAIKYANLAEKEASRAYIELKISATESQKFDILSGRMFRR